MADPFQVSQLGCGCGSQSTQQVCGDFEAPTNPDAGRCHPYRVKRDCEAPQLPSFPCPLDVPYAEVNPTGNPPFIIISILFDEDCDPILDEDGNTILTQLT